MQEPHCKICGTSGFADKGGCYFDFEVTDPEEIAFNKSLKEFQIPGSSPHGEVYFCSKHREIAAKYTHLTAQEAEHLIRAEISEIEKEKSRLSNSLLVGLGSKIKKLFQRFGS